MNVGPVNNHSVIINGKKITTGGNIKLDDKFHSLKVVGSQNRVSPSQKTTQSFFAKLSEKFQSMPLA